MEYSQYFSALVNILFAENTLFHENAAHEGIVVKDISGMLDILPWAQARIYLLACWFLWNSSYQFKYQFF